MPPLRWFRAQHALLALVTVVATACADSTTSPVEVRVDFSSLSGDPEAQKAEVGRLIFNDKKMSLRSNQSCASCHDERFGFTAPEGSVNGGGAVMPGSVPTRFGNRRPPSAAYASFSPHFHYDDVDEVFMGGNFWDGRATGALLGSPVADQAMAPFTNANEMALPDIACAVLTVRTSTYLAQYRAVWGEEIMGIPFSASARGLCAREGTTIPLTPADRQKAQRQFENVARSIAAFEASPAVNKFSSRYDGYVEGRGTLTAEELEGLSLYEGKAGCAACHPNEGTRALFTDFTYDNIGVPPNPLNPARIARGFVDLGLGGVLGDATLNGAQKVPTLRNLDKRVGNTAKSFMHNGAFRTLEQVVHFYNTRDVLPRCASLIGASDPRFGVTCWPAPEVDGNVNVDELGDLGLTAAEERLLVLYLKTLSDR